MRTRQVVALHRQRLERRKSGALAADGLRPLRRQRARHQVVGDVQDLHYGGT